MKTLVRVGFALALVLGLILPAFAGDESVTLTGQVMCAKCGLKKTSACQDVLVVAGDKGNAEYYIVKNDVAKTFGHVCRSQKQAKVTGSVAEKDGQKWLTPTAMEEVKS